MLKSLIYRYLSKYIGSGSHQNEARHAIAVQHFTVWFVARLQEARQSASQMQLKGTLMKTATFPSLRVTPELRQAAEQILQEGETLSSFVEQSIRESIGRRQHQQEFTALGPRSRDEACQTVKYASADSVIGRLEEMLATAKGAK